MIKLKDITLLKILPQFLKSNNKIIYISKSITSVLIEVLDKFSNMKRMEKISTGDLTDQEIEYLLYEKHVDFFDKTLTSAQKIKLIQNAEKAHLKKGTRYVLENHLNIIFGELQLQEWFEAGLEPYHFQIMSNYRISDEVLIRINRTVNEYKTTRSVFEGVKVNEIVVVPYNFAVGIYDIKEDIISVMIEPKTVQALHSIGIYEAKTDTL